MLELISVHLPKTGGTTLRKTLERAYGDRLRLHNPAIGQVDTWRTSLRNLHRATCLHGHVQARRYRFSRAKMITFVRDPVELRISHYHFARRVAPKLGVVNSRWADALAMDLPEYMALKDGMIRFFIGGVPMRRFCFIGSMAHFEDDVRRVCALVGVDYLPARENANPSGSDYTIPEEWRRAYAAANPEEVELYERAMARRQKIVDSPRFPDPEECSGPVQHHGRIA